MADQIIKVLDDLSERIGVSIDWSSENVLPYVQELFAKLVNYRLSTSIIWLVVAAALIVASVITIKKAMRAYHLWQEDEVSEDAIFGWRALSIILIIVVILIIIFQAPVTIRCLTIPELEVYKYISDLLS